MILIAMKQFIDFKHEIKCLNIFANSASDPIFIKSICLITIKDLWIFELKNCSLKYYKYIF
jgi:hypothetical protein